MHTTMIEWPMPRSLSIFGLKVCRSDNFATRWIESAMDNYMLLHPIPRGFLKA